LSNREANRLRNFAKHKSKHHVISLLVFGDANRAEVEIEFLGNTALVEQMFAVEDDDVGGFAAIHALDEDVAVTEAAAGLWTHEDGSLLLLDEFLVKVEVICLEDLVAAVVNRYLRGDQGDQK
jgi:hypothetical protein